MTTEQQDKQVAVFHAMKTATTTWCGMRVGTGKKSGPETPLPLIAGGREGVTCPTCQAKQPALPSQIRAGKVVARKMEAERKRFDTRKGAAKPEPEPGIDPVEIARRVLNKQKGGS